MRIKSIAVAISIALISILIMVTVVNANAPAPPWMYWLEFKSGTSASDPKLQGLQITQCKNAKCQASILLKQYGTCDRNGCLTSPPVFTATQFKPLDLDCAENRCFLALHTFYNPREIDPQQIRFIAQFQDLQTKIVRSSDIFPLGIDKRENDVFAVNITDKNLVILPSTHDKFDRWLIFHQRLFSNSLLLTLAIELTIWGLYLRWKKINLGEIFLTLLSGLMVHAFSFGIVWFSFPGWRHFASEFERYTGSLWLILAIGYGLLPLVLRSQPRWKLVAVVTGSILYWIAALIICLPIAFLTGYGNHSPISAGIPMPLLTVASELFVIGYEAWMIQKFRPEILAFKSALIVSFVANTVSCLLSFLSSLLIFTA